MGVPRLQIKRDLNYRQGYTSRSCGHCNHCVAYQRADGASKEYRCRIIGLNEGRAYRINPKSICDKHDNSNYLTRLRGY